MAYRIETLDNGEWTDDASLLGHGLSQSDNEFASELQRSLNYFTGTDRTATIGKVLLLGNATKLRGLTDFVGQQLQLDVQRLDKFNGLEGASVLANPAFREHQLAYGTAYGLALQAANVAEIR
jgi:Tfp pilus assembly PilM family ATPase